MAQSYQRWHAIRFYLCCWQPFLFGSPVIALAQEPEEPPTVIVVMMDGNERIGQIISDDGREILLKTPALGNIYIQKSEIKHIKPVETGEVEQFDGEFRNTGPFTTRYYFTTNALPVKKREDYAMVHVYGPEVHFSASDNLSLGVMTSWAASPFVLAAKYSIPTPDENVNIAIGTLLGSSGYFNEFRGYGGLHWATITFGDRMRNISISGGYGYVEPGFDRQTPVPGTYTRKPGEGYPDVPYETANRSQITAPAVSVAGITKVGKSASFFFDSMVFFYTDEDVRQTYQYSDIDRWDVISITVEEYTRTGVMAYLMPGMRIQRRANRAFQVALAGVIISEKDPDGGQNDLMTFPVPTCAWLFKF